MPGTVHGLEAVLLGLAARRPPILVLDGSRAVARDFKHVRLEVFPVAGRLPQRALVDVGRQDFLEAVHRILGAQKLDELVVDARTMREEQRRSGRVLAGDEQMLGRGYCAVVGGGDVGKACR